MSIRRRLYILVGVALLPAVLVQAVDQVVLRRERQTEVEANVVERAERVAAQVAQVIEGARQVVQAMAQLREVRTADAAACTETLQALKAQYDGYSSLTAVGIDGRAICTSLGPDTARIMDVSNRDYFQQALATGRLVVGRHIASRYQDRRVLPVSAPFRDGRGEVGGVVILAIDLDWLAKIVDQPDWSPDRTLVVADASGTMLVRHPDNQSFVGQPVPAEIWRRVAAATAPGTFTGPSLDGFEQIAGFVPPSIGPGGLYVGSGQSRDRAFAALNAATLRGIVLIGMGVLAALLLAHFTGERLIRQPVRQLLATAARWRAGDLSARSQLSGTTELGRLGSAFDGMAADLERAFADKDLLLRELSHRVTNSLTAISSMLRMQSMRCDPQARRQLDDAVGRIHSLALTYRRLQMGKEGDRIDFGQYLRDLWEDLLQSVAPPGIQGRVDAETLLITPEQAAPLAIIAHELVTNALKHGRPGGGSVALRLHQLGDAWCLTVTNPGELPAGFDHASGAGFGLVMANALARQAKGNLVAASGNGEVELSVSFIVQPGADLAPEPPSLAA